jgi:VWFA-related protein
MNPSLRTLTFVLCLALLPSPSFSQQQPSASSPARQPPVNIHPQGEADRSELVLDVVVTDKSGKAVAGLRQEDFVVKDNGAPQKVLSFRPVAANTAAPEGASGEPPVKIILLVDEVNTSFSRVAYERNEIQKFLLQNDGKLTRPISFVFFSDSGSEMQNDSSRDGKQLFAIFDQHETAIRSIRRSNGFYGAEERFDLSMKALASIAAKETQEPGRKMLVWISPGWPLLSGPGVDFSIKQRKSFFSSIVRMSDLLQQARVTLYNIDPLGLEDSGNGRLFYYEQFLKPVTEPQKSEIGNLALQVLARQSGGQVLNSSNDLVGLLNRSVADADAYYTLRVLKTPSERPDQFHTVEVKVETTSLTARTRNGYYTAQP